MMSWCKKGGYSAEISPKSERCGFKWVNTHCYHWGGGIFFCSDPTGREGGGG